MLSLKYQGKEFSKSKEEQVYKETWQGSEAEVDSYIQNTLETQWRVETAGKGYLNNYRKQNDQGPFWSVEVEYTRSFSNDSDGDTRNRGWFKKCTTFCKEYSNAFGTSRKLFGKMEPLSFW